MLEWLARQIERLDVAFTRGPSVCRRIGLPLSGVPVERRGAIVVQIDGLSYARMERAMRRHRMPFLAKLVRRGTHRLHPYLSQIPTSTPAFQGGLFYGQNDNIPGFAFYDRAERRVYRMGQSDSAHAIETSFSRPGLLQSGSVFSSVFTGGAESVMFVFSTLLAPARWKFIFRAWDIVILTFLNTLLIVKVAALSVVELLLAIADSLKWVLLKGWVARELTVIAMRIGLTIVTRELITLGAVVDIFRRVPVIYVNYLGYDEQSHLRGPDSRVALWTLKGIDRSIRRIHRASLRAERQYDLYVMSDHGQCACMPFDLLEGETLGEYLEDELAGMLVENYNFRDKGAAQVMGTVDGLMRLSQTMPRIFRLPMRWYAARLQRQLGREGTTDDIHVRLDATVVSTGPVAYVYWTRFEEPLDADRIEELHPGLIDRLASHEAIGCVSMRAADGSVIVRSAHGRAVLREDSHRREGRLPFDLSIDPQHVMEGIRRVTLFARAGDICIWGTNAPQGCVSYNFEFGAHSGWSDSEIQAFIMAPSDIGFDFSSVRRHAQWYDFFYPRYGVKDGAVGEPGGGR